MEQVQGKANKHAEARPLQVYQPQVCMWRSEYLLSRSYIRFKRKKKWPKMPSKNDHKKKLPAVTQSNHADQFWKLSSRKISFSSEVPIKIQYDSNEF